MKSFKFYTSRKDAEKKGDAKPRKELTRADYVGMAAGLFVIWLILQTGQVGIIPALLAGYVFYWIFKKIAEKDRPVSDLWRKDK